MASDRTKACILAAMEAARDEKCPTPLMVLDRLYSSIITGDYEVFFAIEDREANREASREQLPENVTSNADMVYAAGEPLPACSTPHTGRRT